jgi:hypothetical protein
VFPEIFAETPVSGRVFGSSIPVSGKGSPTHIQGQAKFWKDFLDLEECGRQGVLEIFRISLKSGGGGGFGKNTRIWGKWRVSTCDENQKEFLASNLDAIKNWRFLCGPSKTI